jgi:anthranilate phosphoribosyltransferase
LIWEVQNNGLSSLRRITPEDFGLSSSPANSITGGTPAENADTITQIFSGEKGPRRDVVVLNTAAALLAGNKVNSFNQGVSLAQDIIDNGAALAKLKKLIDFTQRL